MAARNGSLCLFDGLDPVATELLSALLLSGLIRHSRFRRTFQIQLKLGVRLGPINKALQVWKRFLPETAPEVG